MIEHLIPSEHTPSIFRHPDLQLHNIFIDPETRKIIGIIDWQETETLPLDLASGCPRMADNEGRKTRNALIPPKEPDYDSLPEEHRHPAREQFLLERAYHLYVLATGTWNPTHFRTMRKPSSCLKASLVERAGTAWNADIMPLQSFIMQVMEV